MIRPFACLNRFALPLALVALCSLGSGTLLAGTSEAHTHSQPASAITAQAARESASARTLELLSLHKRWLKAPTSERAQLHQQLLAKAEQRRQLLGDLMQSHPAEVLRVAIPEEQQQGMPAAVLEFLEQKLELEGELEVVYEDYEDGTHKLRHFVKTPFGERFELHFAGKHPELLSGARVGINGLLLEGASTESANTDGDLALASGDVNILTLAADGGTTGGSNGGTPAAELANTFGEKRTLVLLVNFQDKTDQPYTQQQARDLVFGQTSDLYLENSNNQTWLTGDVAGWFTLPLSSTSCDYYSISSMANDAAAQAGVDTSNYARYVYVFPKNACGWSGLGTMGGNPGWAWINGSFRLNIVAHELGHNFGLYHSKSQDCGTSSIGDNCTVSQYGDFLDTMGNRNSAHFNAFQKARLGWLNGLVSADTDGTYTLEPYETAPGANPKALRVLKNIDPTTGQKSWYYLEYRQALGFDNFLATNNNVQNGVVVHTGTDSDGNSSYLLDMTPDSDPWYDWDDPALVTGDSFTDADAGVTIATSWNDNNGVAVNVTLGPQPCVTAAPTLSLSPSVGPWVAPGTTVSYTLTVTNNDSAACNNTTVGLTTGLPSGWSGTFTNNQLALAPGESTSTEVAVSSVGSASDGFYDIAITAANGTQSTTTTATYVVSAPVTNSAPTANNDSAATQESSPVVIDVLANDSDPDGDSLTLSAVARSTNGSSTINADGTIAYQPNPGFVGTDSFVYTVSDGNGGSDSATVTVTVTAAPNTAPVAIDDSASTPKSSSVTITVLGNDYDPDGDALTVVSVTHGTKGTVTINADGTVTYTAAKSFNSTDSFSYTISDGNHSASATVTVSPSSGGNTSGSTKGGGPNK